MSKPRAPSFGAQQRSRLARRAATARWARLGRGVLTLAQIRDAVVKALAGREAPGNRKAKAYLFGSYARGDAHARSDLDILVITEKMPEDLLGEIAGLSSAMHEALGDDVHKGIDLLLVDEKTFNEHKAKNWDGSVYHEVHGEGVRLA